MKTKQGRKKWKTVTAIGKWLKRYFNRRTARRYDPNKFSLYIGGLEVKGYTVTKEIKDETEWRKIDDNFIGGPLNER